MTKKYQFMRKNEHSYSYLIDLAGCIRETR